MKAIENLLRERIGLDAASIGSSLIERSVRLRMKCLGVKRLEDYRRRLGASDTEWRELVESVVVSETWFFRDRQAFDALVQIVLREWLPGRLAGLHTLRILSAPCSTGEEPYSLAMALLDAGVLAERFVIEAVDISERALACATAAVYGRNAFRGKELDFRDRHFHQSKEGYVLAPRVRQQVRFHRINLLEEALPGGGAPFDFIFCRNLLIYFDRATQAKTLERLRTALAKDGLLFVGPAELPLVTDQGFARLDLAMAFACRHDGPRPRAESEFRPAAGKVMHPVAYTVPTPALTPAPAPTHKDVLRAKLDDPPAPTHAAHLRDTLGDSSSQRGSAQAPAAAPPRTESPLTQARRLADAGKLQEAQQICEAHVSQFGPVAEAFYLLGLVADASGGPGAIEFYRKAIYLEPDHYESLLQLSLLLERLGDRAGAKSCLRRAERVRREVARPESQGRIEGAAKTKD